MNLNFDNAFDKFLGFISAYEQEVECWTACLPEVDLKKCNGCGLCVKMCRVDVLEMRDDKVFVSDGDRCSQCSHCLATCPTGAIKDRLAGVSDTPEFDPGLLPSSKSMQLFFRTRRSIRNYRRKPVSRKDLEKLLEAAKTAPTAGNRPQDAHFIIMTDPADISRLRDMVFSSIYKMFLKVENKALFTMMSLVMGKGRADTVKKYIEILERFQKVWEEDGEDRVLYHAPTVMLVHGTRWDEQTGFSCAVMLYQASLMAHSMKIGCCFNGFLVEAINRDSKVKRWVGVPSDHKCWGAMTLGYEKMKYKRLVRRNPARVTWR